jgi:hypothetical protein
MSIAFVVHSVNLAVNDAATPVTYVCYFLCACLLLLLCMPGTYACYFCIMYLLRTSVSSNYVPVTYVC